MFSVLTASVGWDRSVQNNVRFLLNSSCEPVWPNGKAVGW